MTVVGVLASGIVGLSFYVVGVIMSAQGQLLKATLDNSVHTSPFLTDDQRAHVMFADQTLGDQTSESQDPRSHDRFRNHPQFDAINSRIQDLHLKMEKALAANDFNGAALYLEQKSQACDQLERLKETTTGP